MPDAPITLLETGEMRVGLAGTPGVRDARVLVSFTGIGHKMGAVDVQAPEFQKVGTRFDATYFVSDLTRSWGNRLDFGVLGQLIATHTPGATIDVIGNSMGGFLAVLFARFVPSRTVIAFAPQYSAKPDVVPFDNRWRKYRDAITDWRHPSLEGAFQDGTAYYLFIADDDYDARHAAMFPHLPNVHVTLMDGTHGLAQNLKRLNILHTLIDKCLDGTYALDWLYEQLVPPAT